MTQGAEPFIRADAMLSGTTVIEASAGTGKTWTIEQIVLERVKAGVPMDRIVLMSFTRAAAAELSQRAYEVIRKALNEDALADADKKSQADVRGRLQAAILSFDSSCITTTDGFCLRMLQEHAAEAGAYGLAGWQLDPTARANESRAVSDAWSFTAIFDELWARTAVKLGNVHAALREALNSLSTRRQMQSADYPSTAAAWHAWIVLFAEMTEAHSWLGEIALTMKSSLASDVDELLEGIASWSGACGHDRQVRAVCLGPVVVALAKWCTSSKEVIEASRKTPKADRLRAIELAADPLCAQLLEQLKEGALLWDTNKAAAVNTIAIEALKRLTQRRERLRLFSFQDVLERLADAVRPESSPLLAAVRDRFSVAVVDEFQDTNPLQAEVLRRLFVDSANHDLFLVGDPKQSIYEFRGADVESYLSLRDREANNPKRSHRRSLSVSYRSDAALVQGVNTLFEVPQPFFHGKIVPDAVTSNFVDPRVQWNGQVKDAGIVIHQGVAGQSIGVAWPSIAQGIREELNAGNMVRESLEASWRALRASDIAVLCHKHDQNMEITKQLHAIGVSAIVLGKGSVFQSEVADEVAGLLLAIARPTHRHKALAACAGRLVGLDHAQLIAEPALWLSRIRQARAIFEKYGAAVAIQSIVESFESRSNGIEGLIAEEGGERFLLDYRHLLERLTDAEGNGIRGADALSVWFAEQVINGGSGEGAAGDDPDRTRSIGNVDAVTVQTLHSSKGLTYGVTWLPTFMSAGGGRKNDDCSEEADIRAAGEARRMLYVGLTRSRWRSHLVWIHGKSAPSSPLATIVHARGIESPFDAATRAEERLKSYQLAIDDLALVAALAPSAIAITQLPELDGAQMVPVATAQLVSALAMPSIPRMLDQVSFTGLASRAHRDDGAEELDHDRSKLRRDPTESGYATECDRAIARLKVGGSPLGTALHEALADACAFAGLALGADRAPLEQALRDRFAGIVADDAVGSTLFGDLAHALASALAAPCVTAEIPSVARLAATPRETRREMSIATPWNGSPQDIARAFRCEPSPWSGALAARIEMLSTRELNGLFVGNIDLVALQDGKWFIYDYKSNNLGSSAQNYSSTRVVGGLSPLDEAMVSSLYPLQAALYAVAVERWLATRCDHTAEFATSVGGIAYLFVRGMDAQIEGQGIWEWTPSRSLLCALGECFRPRANMQGECQ